MPDVALTWLGHNAFRFDTPGGKRVYLDPFLENPMCPESEKEPERIDLIAVSHGHDDHVGSTVQLAQRFDCPVIAIVELRGWLSLQGLSEDMTQAFNKGGTVEHEGVKVTMTDAHHSSGGFENGQFLYLGEPCGFVFEVENGTKLYFACDTNVFMDMQLIGEIYEPDLAVLPIGDHYTMGPREAAKALELLGVKRCIPCHYGTFPLLSGTPERLRELTDVEVLAVEPGETISV